MTQSIPLGNTQNCYFNNQEVSILKLNGNQIWNGQRWRTIFEGEEKSATFTSGNNDKILNFIFSGLKANVLTRVTGKYSYGIVGKSFTWDLSPGEGWTYARTGEKLPNLAFANTDYPCLIKCPTNNNEFPYSTYQTPGTSSGSVLRIYKIEQFY